MVPAPGLLLCSLRLRTRALGHHLSSHPVSRQSTLASIDDSCAWNQAECVHCLGVDAPKVMPSNSMNSLSQPEHASSSVGVLCPRLLHALPTHTCQSGVASATSATYIVFRRIRPCRPRDGTAFLVVAMWIFDRIPTLSKKKKKKVKVLQDLSVTVWTAEARIVENEGRTFLPGLSPLTTPEYYLHLHPTIGT